LGVNEIKKIEKIEEALKNVVNHKARLLYIPQIEGTLRETVGVVTDVTKEIIVVKATGNYGTWHKQYINRHACVLLLVEDWGVWKQQ